MQLSDEVIIPLPRQKVWEALNDPDILRQAIPGCEEVIKISEAEPFGGCAIACPGLTAPLSTPFFNMAHRAVNVVLPSRMGARRRFRHALPTIVTTCHP